MGVRVSFLQPFHRYVRIDLGRGKAGMSEQCLDAAQVGAPIEHVRSETMPQFVRTDRNRDGCVPQITLQNKPNGTWGNSPAGFVYE